MCGQIGKIHAMNKPHSVVAKTLMTADTTTTDPPTHRVIAEGWVHGLPDPVQVRRATWADYHDILDIDASMGAYDAGDVLYGKLAMYLKDPDRLCYVGVYQGKVVGYMMCRAVDGGRGMVGRLARLHLSIRQTGAWEFVRNMSSIDALQQYPHVRYYFGCTNSYNEVDTFRKGRIVLVRSYLHITVLDRESTLRAVHLPGNISIKPITISGLHDVISDSKAIWRLLPHGYVVVGREPIRIHRENYHLITAECKHVMATHDVTSAEILTLSFGTGYRSPQGYVYEVDIYTATGSADELAQHVLEHARRHVTNEHTLKLSVFVIQKYGVSGLVRVLSGPDYTGRFRFSDVSNHTLGRFEMQTPLEFDEKSSKL